MNGNTFYLNVIKHVFIKYNWRESKNFILTIERNDFLLRCPSKCSLQKKKYLNAENNRSARIAVD